jgi:DNA-binding FrmR family transcriptional regulator
MEYYDERYPCQNRDEPVNHYDEIAAIRRLIIGRGEGIINMIKERNWKCLEIINQLLAIMGGALSIAGHILTSHMRKCLKEEGFPGDNSQRDKEIKLALKYKKNIIKRGLKSYAKKKLKEAEYDLD